MAILRRLCERLVPTRYLSARRTRSPRASGSRSLHEKHLPRCLQRRARKAVRPAREPPPVTRPLFHKALDRFWQRFQLPRAGAARNSSWRNDSRFAAQERIKFGKTVARTDLVEAFFHFIRSHLLAGYQARVEICQIERHIARDRFQHCSA